MSDARFQCTYCGTRFVNEQRFIKHRCDQMKREDEFNSIDGQTAWSLYQKWMKSYKRLVPSSKAFVSSKYFNSFIRFVAFMKNVRLPDVDIFIELMHQKDISPLLWTHDQVYVLYLEHMDKRVSPFSHAEITINTLFDVAEEKNVDIADIFTVVTGNEIVQLLRQRKISPWILLNSPKFKDFFIRKTSSEEKVIMESIIRPEYWKKKFINQKQDVTMMKKYVAELHL